METVSLQRAKQFLHFSIEDNFGVTGMIRFFGRLPHSMIFEYDSRYVYFKAIDESYFIRFRLHPTKKRIMICETSTGHTIDLYYYNPSFEYAVHKASTTGRKRLLTQGGYAGWGKHVIVAWDNISQEFSELGIQFTEASLRKILDATIERSVF